MATKLPLSLTNIQQRLDSYPIPNADLVIGIGRGGAIPAKMLADKIGSGLIVVTVNYRDDDNNAQRDMPVFLDDLIIPIEKGSKIFDLGDRASST